MNVREEIGSYTAKGEFRNESDVVIKFNNYRNDGEAQQWLSIMGYDFSKIKQLIAVQIPPRISREVALSLGVKEYNLDESNTFKKSDVQVRLEIIIENVYHIENISVKKANIGAGFNQVDKRPVDKYKSFWNIPDSICKLLKYYTGELLPYKQNTRDPRRMFLDEMDDTAVKELIHFFDNNRVIIFNDVLRGRGGLSADWFLVTESNDVSHRWILKDINYVCNFYAQGPIIKTKNGNLKIGKMTMQRKGGTPDPTSLQFKINPLELFNANT